MINELTNLLILSNNSDIDIYYNEEMGFFPTTIFDGNNDIEYKNNIINKSIKLPKLDGIYTKEKAYSLALSICLNNNIIIKKITKDKLKECLEVIHISYLKRDETLGLKKDEHRHSYMTYDELLNRFNNGMFMYGYFDNNKIVGYISFENIENNCIKIRDIVVLPTYQNNGIGKILIDIVKKEALRLNKDKIILRLIYENKKLRNWYKKNGFDIVDIFKFEGSDTKIATMEYNIF